MRMSLPGIQNSYQTQPILVETIGTFRRTQQPLDISIIPEIPQKRKTTDVAFLIFFAIWTVVFLSLMTYTLTRSDIRRLTHGYDSCGNVCGINNEVVDDVSCSGKDMSDKPFFNSITGQCVESCGNSYGGESDRCYSYYDGSFFDYTTNSIRTESTNLTVLCLLGLGFSVVTLLLFRYFVNIFVWTMLVASLLLLFAVTGFFWFEYNNTDVGLDDNSAYLYPAILFTILSIIFTIILLVLISRIKLIIRFYEEAVRIVFAMPLILVEPILTLLSNFIVLSLFVYTFLLMSTSGSLQPVESYYASQTQEFDYVRNRAMVAALSLGVLMTIWMLQFIFACQQMVVSGAIASYYFARDKMAVVSPIYNSFYNLIRYHLGTVAFGSFTITVVTIIKILIRAMANNNYGRIFYYCCFRPLEDLLKYLTSMGYIMTAIHGQSLCRSSLRAMNLIVANLLSAVAMNSIGNFVFFMTKLVVVLLTVGIGFALKASGAIIILGGVAALLFVHCFFVVFEIAVDTIFLCYCEDQSSNDGATNPYYASAEFYTSIKAAQLRTKQIEEAKMNKKKT